MPRMSTAGSITLRYRPELERKHRKVLVEPTPEVWGRYYEALAGLRALNAYEHTEWGGPDYGTEVPEPTPYFRTEYLETYEEWEARFNSILEKEATNV